MHGNILTLIPAFRDLTFMFLKITNKGDSRGDVGPGSLKGASKCGLF